MKPSQSLVACFLLLAFATSSCSQIKKEGNTTVTPQVVWKYDTGG